MIPARIIRLSSLELAMRGVGENLEELAIGLALKSAPDSCQVLAIEPAPMDVSRPATSVLPYPARRRSR